MPLGHVVRLSVLFGVAAVLRPCASAFVTPLIALCQRDRGTTQPLLASIRVSHSQAFAAACKPLLDMRRGKSSPSLLAANAARNKQEANMAPKLEPAESAGARTRQTKRRGAGGAEPAAAASDAGGKTKGAKRQKSESALAPAAAPKKGTSDGAKKKQVGKAAKTAGSSAIIKKQDDSEISPDSSGDRLRDSTPPSSEVAPVKKEPETKSQLAAAAAADPLSPSSSPSKGRSPSSSPSKRRVPIVPGSLPPPEGWKQIYDLVWELRLARDAPVDWAGCEVVGKGSEFHILVALMLSSQTKDQVVSEAMIGLKAWKRGGLTVDSILDMTDTELDTLIAKVGFHNNKTKFIKQTAQIIKDKYDSQVPQSAEELCSLPGIGPKMAYIILSAAFNIVTGIGIDTHMHRIFNILKWVESKTPEQTREQLEGWLPREEWPKINVLFVGLGQGTQQPVERHRLLQRSIDSSRPKDALLLVHQVGADMSSAADKASGETPLMYAVRKKNLEAVETLIQLEVKHQLRNTKGQTALDIATTSKQPKIQKMLVAYAALPRPPKPPKAAKIELPET